MAKKRFPRTPLRRRSQQREPNLRVIELMRRMAGNREGVTWCASLVFAWEIRREDSVSGASVNVGGLTVPVVHLGVDMYQRNGKHPDC
jgi:hypothetical protein